jgi:hypothetical protein
MRTITLGLFALALGIIMLSSTPVADAHGRRDCCPKQTIVLQVCHPCTGCKIDVPVCISACCQGTPCVSFHHTLIGAGKTVFTWPCGCEVVVRYQACGGHRVIVRD